MNRNGLTRRDFVQGTSKLALGGMIVPRHVLGGVGYQAPSDTLNIAVVGAGGMGGENAQELGGENIVAVCDVDFDYVTSKVAELPTDGDENERSVPMEREGGVIFVGDRGILMHETYGGNPVLFPRELHEEAAVVPQT